IGILPVLAISAALSLDALARAVEALPEPPAARRAARLAAAGLCAVVLLGLARRNFTDYFDRYTRTLPLPFAPTSGQAWFVRDLDAKARAAREPAPRYHDLAAHVLYWGHSLNRLLNPGATGSDLVNPP